jgi:hypothetical protein
MAPKRRGGTVPSYGTYGFMAPVVRPRAVDGPGAEPAGDPLKRKLAETLDALETEARVRTVTAMAGHSAGGAPAPAAPAASSLTEAMSAVSEAARVHKDAADTALQLAESERERRMEAEDRVGSALQEGQKLELERQKLQAEMMKPVQEELQALRKERQDLAIAQEQSKAEKLVAETRANLEQMLRIREQERDQAKAQAAAAQAEVVQLKQRETVDDLYRLALENPDDPRLDRARRILGLRNDSDGDEELRRMLRRHKVRLWLLEQEHGVKHRLRGMRAKAQLQEEGLGLLHDFRDVVARGARRVLAPGGGVAAGSDWVGDTFGGPAAGSGEDA